MEIKISMNSHVITKKGLRKASDIIGNEEILGINTNGKEKWTEVEVINTYREDCFVLYCDSFYGAFHRDTTIFTTHGQQKISTLQNNYEGISVEYISNISDHSEINWAKGKLSPFLEALLLRVKKINMINNSIVLAIPTMCYDSQFYNKYISSLCGQINGDILDSIRGTFWCWITIKLHNKYDLLANQNNYKGHPDWISYYLATAIEGKIESIIEEENIHAGLIFGLILKGIPYKIDYSPLYSPININFTINDRKLAYSNVKSVCIKKNENMGSLTTSQANWYPIVNFTPIS